MQVRDLKSSTILQLFNFWIFANVLWAQCPEISETQINPNCTPGCEVCEGDQITIRLKGADLINNSKIDYYIDGIPGFNPNNGQGTKIGSANVITPGGNCRICPELIGFLIDACPPGAEADNEFIVIWTGSGFNTSNFVFDFDANNNFGGGNGDIGSSCGIAAGPAGLIGGCMATSVGSGYNLPGNAVWVIFTSSAISNSYDFSAVCGLGLKVFVSKNSCDRSIGAFSNYTSTGVRTQTMSINGCACASSVSYDTDDPGLTGDGDSWAGGVSNGGCSALVSGAGNYTPAPSIIDPFTFTIPKSWCGKKYEIVGIPNPKPDPMCCPEIFTERFEIEVKCPEAKPASGEVCDNGNGTGTFNLEDYEDTVLGPTGMGSVQWFRDAAGIISISSPFTSPSITIYARVVEGRCKSDLVPVQLKVNPLPIARIAELQLCEERFGTAVFDLNSLIKTINGNNPNLKVRFYEDSDLNFQIFSPYISSTTIIYAITDDGKCISKPVEIKLTVIPFPNAKSISDTLCDDGNGKALFFLKSLDSLITSGTKVDSLFYYEDSLLTKRLKDTLYTGEVRIWIKVYKSACQSLATPIDLHIRKVPQISDFEEVACEDQNGEAFFDLNIIKQKLQNLHPDATIGFYLDSLLTNLAPSAVLVRDSLYLYCNFSNQDCYSTTVRIKLTGIDRPVARSVQQSVCADEMGKALFHLDDLRDSISLEFADLVLFALDSTLQQIISGDIVSSSRTLYTFIQTGQCKSEPAEVHLNASPSPLFNHYNDTITCTHFILPTLIGRNISAEASYYFNQIDSLYKKMPGDSILQSGIVYLFDSLGKCKDIDSFFVDIEMQESAGTDVKVQICEGQLLDLRTQVNSNNKQGLFVDADLNSILPDAFFNSSNLAGKQIRILYVVPGVLPCLPDTAVIQLDIQKKLSAGSDLQESICYSDRVLNLQQIYNFNSSGSLIDSASTGALQGIYWDPQISGPGQFKLYYIVGDNLFCEQDTAVFDLQIKPKIQINGIQDLESCKFIVLPILDGKNLGPGSGYYEFPDGSGRRYLSGDSIFSNITLYAFGIDSNRACQLEIPFKVSIKNETKVSFHRTNLCPGTSFDINGKQYDQNLTSGIEILRSSQNSCDSIIDIKLEYLDPADSIVQMTLCANEFITINNRRYDFNNPSGMEQIKAGSFMGCDSLIHIDLKFHPVPIGSMVGTICESDSILIHGSFYHKGKLSGTDTLFNASEYGCDSLVQIQLNLINHARYILRDSLCRGSYREIAGIRFDENQNQLKGRIVDAAQNGCDSIIDIEFRILDLPETTIKERLCVGEFRVINGNTYDFSHPSGREVLLGAALNGCDSIIWVDLNFENSVTHLLRTPICKGDSIYIRGKYYSENNLTGTDTLFGASQFGCDSILFIQMQILDKSDYFINEIFCPGEFLMVNGIRYDEKHPQGAEVLKGRNYLGCDSTVRIQLDYPKHRIIGSSSIILRRGERKIIDLQTNFIPTFIQWSPLTGLSCEHCLNPELIGDQDIEYLVRLTDSIGCEIEFRVIVLIETDTEIDIPTAFSPNGDLVNDHFKIPFLPDQAQVLQFEIYDRWGASLYSESRRIFAEHRGWDGNFMGQKLNPGVYTYLIKIELPNGRIIYKTGDISLIR